MATVDNLPPNHCWLPVAGWDREVDRTGGVPHARYLTAETFTIVGC